MVFDVCMINFFPVDTPKIKRWSNIWDTDCHAVIAEPSAWQFGDTMHNFACNFVGIVSEEMVDESRFVSSQCSLTNLTQK